ncbi:MAG: type III pantothenate kinase [Acidimicrobiia bacterium]|nr:type III pantothenate kinase [Acidimicrobiia bacterium]
MLLAVDIGNSETVVGLYDANDTELFDHWRIATNDQRTGDEHALLLSQFLAQHDLTFDNVTGITVSSTVPRLTATMQRMATRYFEVPTTILGPGVKTGMPILYEDPKEVGPDRIANAVGAFDLYGGPTIVVDFGTATTFDAITAKGEYAGGAILPGVQISLDALFTRAAAVRRVELGEPRSVIGKTTRDSVQSGVVFGTTALVDGLCERFEEELGEATVISTGGLGGLFSRLTRRIEHHEPWLTLHGLRLIFEKNQ